VIPNWNGHHLLTACLNSLSGQKYEDFHIVVVDNGSTDGSVELIGQRFPDVSVIENKENLGFATAVNQGIRCSDSGFVATLNNDTEAEPGWLAALVQTTENEPDVGMWASKMLFAERPDVINSAGICVDVAGIAWDCRGGERDNPQESEPMDVFGPCGGAALYRRAMLEEIGLFDEDFFAYLEDVDLAWRGQRAGWRCLYVPGARVLHHHSATGVEGSPFKSFQLGRNKVWLLVKNYPFREMFVYGLIAVLYDWLSVMYAVLIRREVHALRGRLAGLRGVRRMWIKRREIGNSDRWSAKWFAPLAPPWEIVGRYRHIRAGKP
jgi:GT2 family glycosyltransferase